MSSDIPDPPNNGAVLNIAQIIRAVMASAAEAEIGAMFINAREAVPTQKRWKKWGTFNPKPRCRRTTQQHML